MVNSSEMIFGVRAVLEALEAGKEVDKILVKRDIQSELSRELFAALKGRTIPVVRVPVEKLNRITTYATAKAMERLSSRVDVKRWCFFVMKRATCFPRITGTAQLNTAPDDIHDISGVLDSCHTFFRNSCHVLVSNGSVALNALRMKDRTC